MASAADPPAPLHTQPISIQRVLPPGEPASAAEIVEGLGLWERPAAGAQRMLVLTNMVSTVDGRASIEGRSGPIAGPADRQLFHALRTPVDAVIVGAGTVRVERYGRIIRDESRRRLRRERGFSSEPLVCIVTATMALPPDLPLLSDPDAHVVVMTPSEAELPPCGARVDYVRTSRDGRIDLPRALSELRRRFGVEVLLCEGGPHLHGEMLAAGLVDELFLSLSAKLAGGDPPGGEAPRITAGEDFEQPRELELLGVLAHDSNLFLRYGVSARKRVSRATTSSSSLAS